MISGLSDPLKRPGVQSSAGYPSYGHGMDQLNFRARLLTAITILFAGCAALLGNSESESTAAPPIAAVQGPLPAETRPAAPQIVSAPPDAITQGPIALRQPASAAAPGAAPPMPRASEGTSAKTSPKESPTPSDHTARKVAGTSSPLPARKTVAAPSSAPEPAVTTSRPPVPAPPAVTEAPLKEAPVVTARPASLDIGSLEKRLRETKAIGVLSKLALKNQIDDLLASFRKAHESGESVAPLRRPYENLLGKVQLLLDSDPRLASEVSPSREAIWRVLIDPEKFRSLS